MALDLDIAVYAKRLEGTTLFRIGSAITDLGKGMWILGVGLAALTAYGIVWRNFERASAAAYFCVAVLSAGVIGAAAKFVFARPRPKLLYDQGIHDFAWFRVSHDWTSFPSGHATTVAAAMTALWYVAPRYRMLSIAVGLVLMSTRFLIHAHYLSDVTIAGAVGIASAVAVVPAFEAAAQRIRRKIEAGSRT
ncbi:MAG: phosphatase PAP2 family protein [Alphaproteobacteria bacterium]